MNYDSPVSSTELRSSLAANPTLSTATQQAIEEILGLDTAEEVAVGSWDGQSELVTPEGEAPQAVVVNVDGAAGEQVELELPSDAMASANAWVFNTDADLTVRFNTVERVIASGNGSDLIEVEGDKNTTLDGGDGNDTLITSGGDDSVTGGAGNDTIDTGAGNDTIVTGIGADTIDAGTGRDVVQLVGDRGDYDVEVVDGSVVITDTTDAANSATIRNAEFISFGDGSETIAVTANETEATILRMYETLLGRTPDNAGAEYWLDELATKGTSLSGFAQSFLDSSELLEKGEMTDAEFVAQLYDLALGREHDEAGMEYWLKDMADGHSRADVTISIVGSAEAAEVVTSVIVIDGLV